MTTRISLAAAAFLLGESYSGDFDVRASCIAARFPEVESVKNDEKRHGDIVSGLLQKG